MRVLLGIGSLRAGGAERVLAQIANILLSRGFEVSLLTLSSSQDDFFPLDHRCNRVTPSARSRPLRFLQYLRTLRAEMDTCDVALSFITEVNVAFALTGRLMNRRVIVSERIHPAFHSGRFRSLLYRAALLTYRLTGAEVVVQSPGVKHLIAKSHVRSTVIPNGVHRATRVPPDAARPAVVTYVGSLTARKRVADLLTAWSLLHGHYPTWTLRVVGDGPLRTSLERQAGELGVLDSVDFMGYRSDVSDILADSRCFVLPSAFEGTSNALLEALSAGCACIASDSPGDSSDLLGQGERGLLYPVGNVLVLADLLADLMGNGDLRASLAVKAIEYTSERDWGNLLPLWVMQVQGSYPNHPR